MFSRNINILVSLFFIVSSYKVPHQDFLNIMVSKDNYDLDKGAVYYLGDFSSIIIWGHSGWGPSAVFNEVMFLEENNYFYLNNIKYQVINKKHFIKGNKLSLKDNENYLYLITCDTNNFNKQILIWAKKV